MVEENRELTKLSMATMRRVLSGEAVGVTLLAVDSSFCKEATKAESSVTDLTLMKQISNDISLNMVNYLFNPQK